jgi:hypothetical protein
MQERKNCMRKAVACLDHLVALLKLLVLDRGLRLLARQLVLSLVHDGLHLPLYRPQIVQLLLNGGNLERSNVCRV